MKLNKKNNIMKYKIIAEDLLSKKNYRNNKLANLIHIELSKLIITKIRDSRINILNINKVTVAQNLRYARIYFNLPLKHNYKMKEILKCLDKAKGIFRKHLANSLNMRYTPELHFIYDSSIDTGYEITQLINNVVI